MLINFTQTKPESKEITFSVKGNNAIDRVDFVLDRFLPNGEDLLRFRPFVKVQSAKKTYIDKDVPSEFGEYAEGKIWISWYLLSKATKYRTLDVQLQFEKGEAVWQTEMVTIILEDNIKADEFIENESIGELRDHENRITALENGSVGYVTEEELTEALSAKADKSVSINGHSLDKDIDLSPSDLGMVEVSKKEVDDIFEAI